MGLLDSIIGGLTGGAGSGMRTQGGGLQGQLLQALVAMMACRAAQGGGGLTGGLGGGQGGGGGGLGGVLGSVLGGGRASSGGAMSGGGMSGGSGGLGTLGGLGALAGLAMLANKLRQGGLGDAVGSWIGTGQNQPVSGQQLQGALGSDVIGELASQFGLSHEEVSGQLASALPEVVDHVTPDGQWPDDGASASGDGDVAGLQDIGDLLRRFQAR
jgi:uncharacterized protein YidB (DUF937 family)